MSYTDGNSYEEILNRCLSDSRLESIDKREGSIIYDALAPLCLELADAYVQLEILSSQTHISTATGSNLDDFAYTFGFFREKATKSLVIGEFKKYAKDDNNNYVVDSEKNKILVDMEIPINSRFIDLNNIPYVYIGDVDNLPILRCEYDGSVGNNYTNKILPTQTIKDLVSSKIVRSYQSARDEETDDELRARIIDLLSKRSFGGNIQDYIDKTRAIDGVGNLKVYPAYKHPGGVLLSIVSEDYQPCNDEFIQKVKDEIDPEKYTGQGVGIAPIGHYVTVTTPQKLMVNITFDVVLESGYKIEVVLSELRNLVEEYFISLRKTYSQNSNIIVYQVRIIDNILRSNKVVNVRNLLLNGNNSDIIITDTAGIGTQYLPYIGEFNGS